MKSINLSAGKAQHGTALAYSAPRREKTFCLFTFVFCLALCSAPSALGQTPQGFTYQAVALDGSGEPIRNHALPVRITIQSEAGGGTIFWQELHSAVTTNSSGMFTLIVGMGVKQSGTANAFADIDWSLLPKYIKTEIDYGGWQDMGASQLWSVPYSMMAGDISGSLKKLEVTGAATGMDEALFEVKNKNGQTVFAVYNEGVRIYVGDGSSKAVKGGFAIGTFDESKADTLDLMVVNKDSVRVYIYDDPLNKAVKGGFAIGGFDESKSITNDYLLVSPDSVRVYIDNDASKAVKGGFAIGGFDMSKATDQEYLRITNDSIRMYIDDQSKAVKGGFAIGGFDESKAGVKSFFDVNTSAAGFINPSENRILWYPLKNAFLTGRILIEHPDSVGENSFSSGYESKAIGDYSQALGLFSRASGDYATALGDRANASGYNSTAIGNRVIASGGVSYAMGYMSKATAPYTIAMGSIVEASGHQATAMGYTSLASGDLSFSIGNFTEASGSRSIAFGNYTVARSGSEISMGAFNTDYEAINPLGWNELDRLFVIGNGISAGSRSNAITVLKNGHTAIGNIDPTEMLDVNGNARLRMIGSGEYAYPLNVTVNGTLTTSSSDYRMKENICTLSNSLNNILKLRGVLFTWKSDPKMCNRIGMVAQEVERVFPELVFTNEIDGFKGIYYAELSAVLVEAVKEQQAIIEKQNLKIESQQAEFDKLKAEVEALKAMMMKENK